MPTKLIAGPINSGKTSALFELVRTKINKEDFLYVVPTDQTAEELSSLALQKTPAILGNTFISWRRFTNLAANTNKTLLNSRQSMTIVLSAMQKAKLKYFTNSFASSGTAKIFLNAISTIKESGVALERLREILDVRIASDRERDLLSVFSEYEEILDKKNAIDDGGMFLLALKNIKDGSSPILSSSEIIFDEFTGLPISLREAISAIKTAAPSISITVSIPTTSNEDAFYAPYLKRCMQKAAPLFDEVIELKARDVRSPKIKVVKVRSQIQESRFCTQLILENTAQDKESFSLIYRDAAVLREIISQASSTGILPYEFVREGQYSSPLINEALSLKSADVWPTTATPLEYKTLVDNFISSKDESDSSPKDMSELAYFARHQNSKERLQSATSNIVLNAQIAGLETISKEIFSQMLADELTGFVNTQFEERRFPVQLKTFDSAPTLSTTRTIVTGMLEGNIPSQNPERIFFAGGEDLSPFPDQVIEEIFESAEDRLAIDSFIFDSIINKCTEELILVYPAVNAQGSETTASSFLDAMPDAIFATPLQQMSKCHLEKNFEKNISKAIKIEIERLRGTPETPTYHAFAASDEALELLNKRYSDKAFGATDLEKFAECPFQFYAEKVLGLAPPDEDSPELLPRHRGTILHEVLQDFYTFHKEDYKRLIFEPRYSSLVAEIIDSLVDKQFGKHQDLTTNVKSGLMDFQRTAISIMCKSVVFSEAENARELSAAMLPEKCEWSFGFDDENFLPLRGENLKPAKLKGKIDRIDLSSDGKAFMVVDYKTGDVKAVKNDILKGIKLQLPLYVSAIKKFLYPDLIPVGGFLLATKTAEKRHGFAKKDYKKIYFDCGRAQSTVSEEDFDNLINVAEQFAAKYANAISSGAFGSGPPDKCKDYCKYSYACRFSRKSAE